MEFWLRLSPVSPQAWHREDGHRRNIIMMSVTLRIQLGYQILQCFGTLAVQRMRFDDFRELMILRPMASTVTIRLRRCDRPLLSPDAAEVRGCLEGRQNAEET